MVSQYISRPWITLTFLTGERSPCFATVSGQRDKEYIVPLDMQKLMRKWSLSSLTTSQASNEYYVTNLRDMARSCNYGTLQDQIVRDQFIGGILCVKTREKLLLEADELTLDKAVAIALQVEAATECSTLLADARPLVDAPTQQM